MILISGHVVGLLAKVVDENCLFRDVNSVCMC